MELPDFMKYANKFSQSDFVDKIAKIAKRAGAKLVYAALILYYTLQSDKVPIAGLTDDLAVLLFVLKKVWTDVDPDIQQKAKDRLSKWFDNDEIDEIKDLFKTEE